MSGTSKSSLLNELAARGYRTVDTTAATTSRPGRRAALAQGPDQRAAIRAPDELPGVLFVQGTTGNQSVFYPLPPHRVAQRAGRGAGRTADHPHHQPPREGSS